MPGDPVGGRGVEIIIREKGRRGVDGGDFPIKEKGAAVSVNSREFHVVGDDENGDALRLQSPKYIGQILLGVGVDALGRFVQKQDFRLEQQHFRQRAFCCSPPLKS